MTPVRPAINNTDVQRSATRGCRRDASAPAQGGSSDSIRFCPCIARTCAKGDGSAFRRWRKNSRRSVRFAKLCFHRLREKSNSIVTMKRWRSHSLHQRYSLRGSPNSAECTAVSAEKLERGGSRGSSLRPKANAFLVAGWPTGEAGFGNNIS